MTSLDLPSITVVTPSFNQAEYLEQTILSVLGQNYASLEYYVFDAGSSDGSAAIIEQYQDRLAGWRSEPDNGQAAALNEAFAQSSGQILCWLNSDDYLLPGALLQIGRAFRNVVNEPRLVYGKAFLFHETEGWAKVYNPGPFDRERFRRLDYIVQPSSFWTRRLWELTGPLDATLHFAFDWDWYLRASRHAPFEFSDAIFSAYRHHARHKTSSAKEERWNELIEVARRHAPPEVLEHYRFMFANRRRLKTVLFRMRLYQGFKYCSFPWPDLWADLCVPQLWNFPRRLQRQLIWEMTGLGE